MFFWREKKLNQPKVGNFKTQFGYTHLSTMNYLKTLGNKDKFNINMNLKQIKLYKVYHFEANIIRYLSGIIGYSSD